MKNRTTVTHSQNSSHPEAALASFEAGQLGPLETVERLGLPKDDRRAVEWSLKLLEDTELALRSLNWHPTREGIIPVLDYARRTSEERSTLLKAMDWLTRFAEGTTLGAKVTRDALLALVRHPALDPLFNTLSDAYNVAVWARNQVETERAWPLITEWSIVKALEARTQVGTKRAWPLIADGSSVQALEF